MPRQTRGTSGIKRGVGQDAAKQKDIAGMDDKPVRAKGLGNPPPPAREASQTSSKAGVQKNAPDASTKGVNISNAKAGSKSKKS